MAPRPTKTHKGTPSDSAPSLSVRRSMKDNTTGPSIPKPLSLAPNTAKTRKRPLPTTPVRPRHNDRVPSPTASVDSKRRTASHRARNEEVINAFPVRRTEVCTVFVFGAGSMGELGLGATEKDRDVKRPRVNAHLVPEKMGGEGVVDVAVGGMHVAALDRAGDVWTWGVNDQGSLGRDTKGAAVGNGDVAMRDRDGDVDSDDEEELLNVLESRPGVVQGFPDGVKVVKLACGDSISVAIADNGLVYSWGTFRASDGVLGYSKFSLISPLPTAIDAFHPYMITQVVCGTDHVLALSTTGRVYAWGNGQQFQMGRRVIERSRTNGLIPRPLALTKIRLLGAGAYHSFAVNTAGETFVWGLNQFGQCGVGVGGEDGASITSPTIVEGLRGKDIVWIGGGEQHSLALTREGALYAWGRLDIFQLGLEMAHLPAEAMPVEAPRYLPAPTQIPEIPPMISAACGTHHNIAISTAGEPYAWGYGESWQVGLGPGAGDVERPTKIENTATRGVKMVMGGAGGQFSVLLGLPPHENGENGV